MVAMRGAADGVGGEVSEAELELVATQAAYRDIVASGQQPPVR
jgi:hypothetical protein